jgi:hypothetical protein
MANLKRTRTRRLPSALVTQIDICHNAACADIEKQRVKAKAWNDLYNTRHASRWKSGTCLICGEYMEYCITNYHAQLHGYKSAEALIRAGKICFE